MMPTPILPPANGGLMGTAGGPVWIPSSAVPTPTVTIQPPASTPAPAAATPAECRGVTYPTAKGLAKGLGNSVRGAVHLKPSEVEEGDSVTLCWSDVWIYGAGLGLMLVGALMLFRSN